MRVAADYPAKLISSSIKCCRPFFERVIAAYLFSAGYAVVIDEAALEVPFAVAFIMNYAADPVSAE